MADEKKTPRRGISRRSFIKGFGGGVLSTATLANTGLLSRELAESFARAPGQGISGRTTITLHVNGKKVQAEVEPRTTLLRALRDIAGLTGSKEVCDRGQCGACTVLADGKPILSCMTLALDATGSKITTVEGLEADPVGKKVQQKFVEKDGLMCGYCTPGFVVSATALLHENPQPSQEDIKQGVSGNLCRCGTYPKVFEAIAAAAKKA